MEKGNQWLVAGCVLACAGVALGAFGAHFLASYIGRDMLFVYHTGVQYQMYHALALIGLGVWVARDPGLSTNRYVKRTGYAFVAGILIFSGSLYLLASTGFRKIGFLTPVGGVLFLTGWWSFAVAALGRKS